MSSVAVLSRETTLVQNPALGGVLIWRCTVSYERSHRTREGLPLPLGFVVLPVLLHDSTFAHLKGTQKQTGLHGFARKFSPSSANQTDELLSIHLRARSWRDLSWSSIQIGVSAGLLTLVPEPARLVSRSESPARGAPQTIKSLVSNSEKLGAWFAEMSLFEVSQVLEVSL